MDTFCEFIQLYAVTEIDKKHPLLLMSISEKTYFIPSISDI